MRRLGLALVLSLFASWAAAQAPAPEDATKAQQERQVTQPGNNAPVWREVRKEGSTENYTSIKGRETNVLVQSAGNTWRQIRNGPVTFYGGGFIVFVLLVIAGLYFAKGPIKLHEARSGRMLPRFSDWERVVHWSVAISFCVLGLSGLIMLFGKHLLLPVIGYTLFAWLSYLGKNLHNFVAPFFIVSVLIMAFMWARDNIWRAYDWSWFGKMWAFATRGAHVPSGRFNAGEKAWFWGGVVLLSIVMAWSGLILLFPNFDQTRSTMQWAWIWHASAAVLYIVGALGHIYMGTIGVEGAYQNMREGVTDETWAKEHHRYWYDEVKSGRRQPASGGAVPAGAPHMKERP
jgi:formate dehydrogenase subunit gamma